MLNITQKEIAYRIFIEQSKVKKILKLLVENILILFIGLLYSILFFHPKTTKILNAIKRYHKLQYSDVY